MRLIAGCDLAPHDVQAILDGNISRLEEHMLGELDHLEGVTGNPQAMWANWTWLGKWESSQIAGNSTQFVSRSTISTKRCSDTLI